MTGKSFEFVEKKLRKKSFGIISTIDSKGRPHSTGLIYTIAPKPNPFHFYVITGAEYRKTKYIEANPNVAFMVTFPHHWLRFVPASAVHFQGKADILPFEDSVGRESFMQSSTSRSNLNSETDDERIFIRIKPSKKLNVWGLGIPLMQMRGDHASAGYKVEIPKDLR